jgi:hypothetical protein
MQDHEDVREIAGRTQNDSESNHPRPETLVTGFPAPHGTCSFSAHTIFDPDALPAAVKQRHQFAIQRRQLLQVPQQNRPLLAAMQITASAENQRINERLIPLDKPPKRRRITCELLFTEKGVRSSRVIHQGRHGC